MSKTLSIIADRQIIFAQEVFSRLGNVELVDGRKINRATVRQADVLLVRSVTPVNETLLNDSPVRFVGSATSGVDHIDSGYLESAGIRFVHAPGSNARSVAEYVLSGLLTLAELHEFDPADKTVGIIGCGAVGSRLAGFLKTLGISCLLNDPPLQAQNDSGDYVDLEQILTTDIISLHVPLTVAGEYPTYKMVNKTFLERLSQDVILINTARGEVINEHDLLAFKRKNPASTLMLDVWCNEPDINTELLTETLIATPHIAGYSYDAKLKATQRLSKALTAYLDCSLIEIEPGLMEKNSKIMMPEQGNARLAVRHSYDIRADAEDLKNTVTMDKEKRALYFDNLRKNYPLRREFPGHIICSDGMDNNTQTQLRGLGYKLETA